MLAVPLEYLLPIVANLNSDQNEFDSGQSEIFPYVQVFIDLYTGP